LCSDKDLQLLQTRLEVLTSGGLLQLPKQEQARFCSLSNQTDSVAAKLRLASFLARLAVCSDRSLQLHLTRRVADDVGLNVFTGRTDINNEDTTSSSRSHTAEPSTSSIHSCREPSVTGMTCPRKSSRPRPLTHVCQGPPDYSNQKQYV